MFGILLYQLIYPHSSPIKWLLLFLPFLKLAWVMESWSNLPIEPFCRTKIWTQVVQLQSRHFMPYTDTCTTIHNPIFHLIWTVHMWHSKFNEYQWQEINEYGELDLSLIFAHITYRWLIFQNLFFKIIHLRCCHYQGTHYPFAIFWQNKDNYKS